MKTEITKKKKKAKVSEEKEETVIRLERHAYESFKSLCKLQGLNPLVQINEVLRDWIRNEKKHLGELWSKTGG